MLRSSSRSSQPSSQGSPSSSKRHRLGMAGVANLFIRLRRLKNRAKSKSRMVLTSGDPQTHPGIIEGVKDEESVPAEYNQHYVCSGGVNVGTLLRATRNAFLDDVSRALGANALVEEQWECTVNSPKSPTADGLYEVDIRYAANVAKSSQRDPRRPVALNEAKNIPGLMTIVKRSSA